MLLIALTLIWSVTTASASWFTHDSVLVEIDWEAFDDGKTNNANNEFMRHMSPIYKAARMILVSDLPKFSADGGVHFFVTTSDSRWAYHFGRNVKLAGPAYHAIGVTSPGEEPSEFVVVYWDKFAEADDVIAALLQRFSNVFAQANSPRTKAEALENEIKFLRQLPKQKTWQLLTRGTQAEMERYTREVTTRLGGQSCSAAMRGLLN